MKLLLKSITIGISVAVLLFIIVAIFAGIIGFLDALGVPYVLGFFFLVVTGVVSAFHYFTNRGKG